MDQRYQRAKEIFLKSCDVEPQRRAALLEAECGGDAALRAEVDSLLAFDRGPGAGEPAAGPTEGGDGAAVRTGAGLPNGHIGPYRIVRELGHGGMGVVYLALREEDQLRRRVAIKVLRRGMDTEQILRRFDLERQVLAALNHPNIARLYDGGETADGRPYFVMEYIEGRPIDKYCDTERLHIAQRLEVFEKVCRAVHHAHRNLVVHRDLKPGNILVTGEGEPKLLDFGIARLLNPDLAHVAGDPTAPELRVMTPEYASPEQVRGEPVSIASDIYSLGVLLYELVCGHRPYRLRSRVRAEIERAVCEQEPELPSTAVSRVEELDPVFTPSPDSTGGIVITPESVSRTREGRPERLRRRLCGDIDNIVLMAMRKESHRRYASAEQFAADIRRHLEGLPVIARPDTLLYRGTKFVQRHRAGVGAAAAIAVLLVGGVTVSTAAWRTAERERITAEREQAAAQRAESAALAAKGEAVSAREVAERERGEAETARAAAVLARAAEERERRRAEVRDRAGRGLARVFMFDLHDAIQRLDGSLPARQLLVSTAWEYLEELASGSGDDPALVGELADAYDRLGSIRGGVRNPSEGDPAAALEAYAVGLGMRERLLAAAPGDLELQGRIAVSRMHVGDALVRLGRTAEARSEYRNALEIQERLAERDPTRRRDHALALLNIGRVLIDAGMHDEARSHYEHSLRIRRALLAERPGDPDLMRDVSVALNRIGGDLARLGNHEAALEKYRESSEIREARLGEEPDELRARRDVATMQLLMADELIELGRIDDAEAAARRCLALSEENAQRNATDVRSQRDVARCWERLGRVQAARGDWEGALRSYGELLARVAGLEEASDVGDRALAAGAHLRLCEARTGAGAAEQAVVHGERAVAIFTALAQGDPLRTEWPLRRAESLRGLGEALARAGEPGRAEGLLEEGRGILRARCAAEPGVAGSRRELGLTLKALGSLAAAAGRFHAAAAAVEEGLAALEGAPFPGAFTALRRGLEDDLARYRRAAGAEVGG
jgi:serine/threonine protein kinase/tetratricopeptide (TPR) repeat protein